MNGLTEICHCGHAKETHYWDRDKPSRDSGDCLGMACECKKYENSRMPRTGVKINPTLELLRKTTY